MQSFIVLMLFICRLRKGQILYSINSAWLSAVRGWTLEVHVSHSFSSCFVVSTLVLERLCAPSPGPALHASIISLLFVSSLLWSAYFWWGGHRVIKEDSDRLVLCELPENSLFKPLVGKRMYFSLGKHLYRWVWNGWIYCKITYLELSLKTLRWYLVSYYGG